MTIIKTSRMLAAYPFLRLDEAFRDAFMTHARKIGASKTKANIKLFECYCDITQNDVKYISLSSPAFNKLVRGFLGALDSEDLISLSSDTRIDKARCFTKTLLSMRSDIPALNVPDWNTGLPANCRPEWDALLTGLDEDAKKYWCCWPIKGSCGTTAQSLFHLVWRSHGATFAMETYEAIRLYLETKSREDLAALNSMLKFLSERSDLYPTDTFQDPIRIHNFFKEFCKVWFHDGYKKQVQIRHHTNR